MPDLYESRVQLLLDCASDPCEDPEIREGCAAELLAMGLAELF